MSKHLELVCWALIPGLPLVSWVSWNKLDNLSYTLISSSMKWEWCRNSETIKSVNIERTWTSGHSINVSYHVHCGHHPHHIGPGSVTPWYNRELTTRQEANRDHDAGLSVSPYSLPRCRAASSRLIPDVEFPLCPLQQTSPTVIPLLSDSSHRKF